MVPKVEGLWDIHYVDRLLAQLEAKAELDRPLLVHAILETAQGVTNLEDIATASPRMQGMSFGPADLAASRRMKTTRVGGGHPGYRSMEDPTDPANPEADRVTAQQDPGTTRSLAWWTPARARASFPSTAPSATSRTPRAARPIPGRSTRPRWCLVAAPGADRDARFSPPPDEVLFAKKVLEAIPDGKGVHMIDGKMQDDATWKQCKVMVDLAEMLAKKDRDWRRRTRWVPDA